MPGLLSVSEEFQHPISGIENQLQLLLIRKQHGFRDAGEMASTAASTSIRQQYDNRGKTANPV
jgi:hypothetical protein